MDDNTTLQLSGQQHHNQIANILSSQFPHPSFAPLSAPRRLLFAAATAGIPLRLPVQHHQDFKTNEDDEELFFYEDDNDGHSEITATEDDNNNEDRGCFIITRRRHQDRSPESCVDHVIADYYSQTEGDNSE